MIQKLLDQHYPGLRATALHVILGKNLSKRRRTTLPARDQILPAIQSRLLIRPMRIEDFGYYGEAEFSDKSQRSSEAGRNVCCEP